MSAHTAVIHVTAKTGRRHHHRRMPFGFHVIRKLDNGELLPVTWRADLDSAENLLRELAEFWPGTYWIEEAAGTGAPSARFTFPGNEMLH